MKQLDDLNDKIVSKAIKLLDTDSLARKLAKDMQKRLEDDFQEVYNQLNLSDWLIDEITSDKTVAGRAFNKAMKSIADNMVKSLKG